MRGQEERPIWRPLRRGDIANMGFAHAANLPVVLVGGIRAHVRRGGRVPGICSGYQMLGRRVTDPRPFARLEGGEADGAVSADGRVASCYLHGLLHGPDARAAILGDLGAASDRVEQGARVEAALDELAGVLAKALDIDAIARIAGL